MYPPNYKSGDEDDGGDRNPYRSYPSDAPHNAGAEPRTIRSSALKLRTFQEWSDDGYQILKGSKHVARNKDGVCLFSSEQVRLYSRSVPSEEDLGDWDYEDMQDMPGNPADYGDS